MHKHPHRSVSKILQSERQSNPNSFHDECKRVAHQHLIILHEINSAIYLERVYIYQRSQPPPITTSTMHKQPCCSAFMMLQSEYSLCHRIIQQWLQNPNNPRCISCSTHNPHQPDQAAPCDKCILTALAIKRCARRWWAATVYTTTPIIHHAPRTPPRTLTRSRQQRRQTTNTNK